MQCSECRSETVTFAVPAAAVEYAPGGAAAAAICTSCLSLQPAEGDTPPTDLTQVSDAFPADEEAAAEIALVVGLMKSLALNRPKIEELLTSIEARGVDPMLALEELEADSSLSPVVAIGRRRSQLEQLLDWGVESEEE
ncbi:DUF6276 family protein [Haloarchaeobius sp. TZWWS8]|uniref:DUF6276 family protein n=1 Tax=Haloarchaeobius sp. TZWWS8 TaxID=3446121 RepID=UPI003EB9DB22